MADTETIEGTIRKLTAKDGQVFGLALESYDGYLNYTKPEWRQEPWDEHKEGDTVKLAVDGKYIKAIKVTGHTESTPTTPSPDNYRSLHRLEALKAAREDMTLIGTITDIPATLHRAEAYAQFIEGDGA